MMNGICKLHLNAAKAWRGDWRYLLAWAHV